MLTLTDILKKISVLNRDNGKIFTDTSRLDVISESLEHSRYINVRPNERCLFHLYSTKPLETVNENVVVISSHIDCEEDITKCFTEILPDGLMNGTFDNSITNAAVLYTMLQNKLPENVLVAFTGDEERDSRGAAQLIRFLRRSGVAVKCVIVLDVTDMGWDEGADFTIENNFWSGSIGRKVTSAAENCGFKWRFVPSDPDDIPAYIGNRYVIPFEAEEYEFWEYDENDVQCFSLCLPVRGEMHSNRGVYARLKSFER